MIKLLNNAKLILGSLLLCAILFAFKSNDTATASLLKEKIGLEVNGKAQLEVNGTFKQKWEARLIAEGHQGLELEDFVLVEQEDESMYLATNSTDNSVSLGIDVIKEDGVYYALNNQNIKCIGDPGCDAGCKKYKRKINGRIIWLCPGRCNNGVDCVTTTVIIINN